MRLRRIEAPWQPTMGTDGVHMFYNAAFVESLPPAAVIACVAHECMHNAMAHFTRRGQRDPLRMNLGGDMAINPIIRDAGLALPKEAVYPAMFKFPEGESMEWYADRLPQSIRCGCGDGDGSGSGSGSGGSGSGDDDANGNGGAPPGACTEGHGAGSGSGSGERGCSGVYPYPGRDANGDPQPGTAATASDVARAASEWRIATTQAANLAKAAGKLPSALDRFVEELRAPSVDWRDVLRRFVSAVVKDDYRMFPPNRRFISSGLYMPSMRSDTIGEVLFVVDSSGSIGGAEFAAFASEANAILNEVRPTRVHLLYHATSVHQHEEFTPDEYPVAFKTSESGGTNFQCVVDYAARAGIDPVCAIWFTDMYPDYWPSEPPFPVLWAATTAIVAPFGETVRIEVE